LHVLPPRILFEVLHPYPYIVLIPNTPYTMKSVAKKDEAVSPVIGTILLVAIVAAVVMGMVGGIGDSKNVGVNCTAVCK
jgi:flagellin-like protein